MNSDARIGIPTLPRLACEIGVRHNQLTGLEAAKKEAVNGGAYLVQKAVEKSRSMR